MPICNNCKSELYFQKRCKKCGTPNPYITPELERLLDKTFQSGIFSIAGQQVMLAIELAADEIRFCDSVHGAVTFPIHLFSNAKLDSVVNEYNPRRQRFFQYMAAAAMGVGSIFDANASTEKGVLIEKYDYVFSLKNGQVFRFSPIPPNTFIPHSLLESQGDEIDRLSNMMNTFTRNCDMFTEAYNRQCKQEQ